MNYFFIIILFAITLLMSFKNIKRAKEYKKSRGYNEAYSKVLRNDEGAYEELVSYIEKEEDPILKSKATLVKIFEDLGKDDVTEEFNNIDITNIFYENDVYSNEKTDLNSEAFLWLILILSRAYNLSLLSVMKTVYEKVNEYENDLNNRVEYQIFKSTYQVLIVKEVADMEFIKSLLAGEYSSYVYYKNLIGIYKKVAACLLAFVGETIDESDKLLIEEFIATLIGRRFAKDIGIYDKYKKDEVIEEENTNEEMSTEDEEAEEEK